MSKAGPAPGANATPGAGGKENQNTGGAAGKAATKAPNKKDEKKKDKGRANLEDSI